MEFKDFLRISPKIQGLNFLYLKTFQREFCLLLPLLSGHALSTWYTYFGFISTIVRWMKIQSEIEVDDWLWTSNSTPVKCLFQNKVMFLRKITTKFMTNLYWVANLHRAATCPYPQGKNPTYKTNSSCFSFACQWSNISEELLSLTQL